MNTKPSHGPIHFRAPAKILWRTIRGYQIVVLHLLLASSSSARISSFTCKEDANSGNRKYYVPAGVDLLKDAEYASQAALWGIEALPELGEIYPLGGSGDRLGLTDPETGECLPAAMLPYCGRTLLEGLIRDLQDREFLYFKIFGGQCITPVAIMTSSAKGQQIILKHQLRGFMILGTLKYPHRILKHIVLTDDGETLNFDDHDHVNCSQLEEMDRNKVPPATQKKKKALLQRFGDMLKKKGKS